MIIQQYLQEVLFSRQVAVVPRIGTFHLQHVPARYHAADRTLTPPQQLVTFSPLWDNDGDCQRWIAHNENLLDYAAELRMNKGLEEILQPLAAGEKVQLEGIGTLEQDAHGHITFLPVVLPGHMDTLNVAPQTHYTPAQPEPAPPLVPETLDEETPETLIPDAPVDNTGGDDWDTPEAPRKSMAWIAIPVVIIILLTGLGIWWYTSQQPAPAEEQPKPLVDSSLTEQASVQDSTVTATPETATTAPSIAPAGTTYRVVFRSYPRSDSAKAYIKYKQLQTDSSFRTVLIYPSSDTAFFRIAMPTAAADTAGMKKKMASYKLGKVYVEQ